MRKVLCFGDSNVFGFNPINGGRYPKEIRWSGILADELKKINIQLDEDGLNNRTLFSFGKDISLVGEVALNKLNLAQYDDIILCLGINNLQIHYEINMNIFESRLSDVIESIKFKNPKIRIIILVPSIINENILNSYFSSLFNKESIKKSHILPEIYKKIANKFECEILNLNDIVKVSEIDSLHYDEKNHKKIADCLFEYFLE